MIAAMKVYVHAKSVILVGKAWEIRQKLREFQKQYKTLKEWVDAIHSQEIR
jgi:hypothetical protein